MSATIGNQKHVTVSSATMRQGPSQTFLGSNVYEPSGAPGTVAANAGAVVVGEVPPAFVDLNKNVKDLFMKNYFFGFGKIDVTTVTSGGVQVRGIGQQDLGEGTKRAFGSLEHKWTYKPYGLTITERWSTDNMLNLETSVENQVVNGLKTTFIAGLSPQTGKRSASILFAYKQPYFHATTDVDLDFAGPVVRASAVTQYQNFRLGGHAIFDSARSAITRYVLALGMAAGRYVLHGAAINLRDFEMGVWNRVDPRLEVGFQSNFSSTSGAGSLAVGAKYDLDQGASVKAKVDNDVNIGLSYTHALRPGVKLTLSTLLNGQNLGAGGHRYGFGLEFDL